MKKILFCLPFLAIMLFGVMPTVKAQESSGVVARGFQVSDDSEEVVTGAIVSFVADDSEHIELATIDSAERLAGVVDNNSLVTISANDQETRVVLSGTTSVLVSDINGQIRAGDRIALSPIAGVGMLATTDAQVVGTAQADFDTKDTQSKTIKDSKGKSHTVHIGYVPLQVGIAYYQAPGSNFLPPFVQNIADSIAGKQVSFLRVIVASILLLISLSSVIVLIYSSVRSAITSVGRNPLAAAAIRKSLYQVIVVVGSVTAGTLLASYLVLSI